MQAKDAAAEKIAQDQEKEQSSEISDKPEDEPVAVGKRGKRKVCQ